MSGNKSEEKRDFEVEDLETREWLESLDYVIQQGGPNRVKELLGELQSHAYTEGIKLPFSASTPYVNTIPYEEQPAYPVLVSVGDYVERDQNVLELETDKAVLEVPTEVSGVVEAVFVKEGEQLRVGEKILTVSTEKGTEKKHKPREAGLLESEPRKAEAPERPPTPRKEVREEAVRGPQDTVQPPPRLKEERDAAAGYLSRTSNDTRNSSIHGELYPGSS